MKQERTQTGETVCVFEEIASERVYITLKATLENGVTLFFDDKKGCALGSDGLVYAPVCRCPEGEDEDAEVIGWCAAAREVIM